jgi:hypothetical protein
MSFALFKTTSFGLKLGLVATTPTPSVRSAMKCFLRQVLNIEGVYAEVSDRLEQVLDGFTLIIPSTLADDLTAKSTHPLPDGLHYERHITNVGKRSKLLVGRPLLLD